MSSWDRDIWRVGVSKFPCLATDTRVPDITIVKDPELNLIICDYINRLETFKSLYTIKNPGDSKSELKASSQKITKAIRLANKGRLSSSLSFLAGSIDFSEPSKLGDLSEVLAIIASEYARWVARSLSRTEAARNGGSVIELTKAKTAIQEGKALRNDDHNYKASVEKFVSAVRIIVRSDSFVNRGTPMCHKSALREWSQLGLDIEGNVESVSLSKDGKVLGLGIREFVSPSWYAVDRLYRWD